MPEKKRKSGYGRPPERTRFKPGQSGNPKGRPKGSKNWKTLLIEELEAVVLVRENGSSKEISKQTAMIRQMVNKALTGDPRTLQQVFKLLLTVTQDEQKSQPMERLGEADFETMASFNKYMEKLNASGKRY